MTAVFLPFEMLRALSRSARAAKTVCLLAGMGSKAFKHFLTAPRLPLAGRGTAGRGTRAGHLPPWGPGGSRAARADGDDHQDHHEHDDDHE